MSSKRMAALSLARAFPLLVEAGTGFKPAMKATVASPVVRKMRTPAILDFRFWILDWVVAIVRSPSSLVREPKSETQPSPTGRGWRSRSRGRAGCGVTWLCRPIRSLPAVQVTPHPARVPHARDRGPLPLGEGKDPIPSCSPRERGQMTKVGPPCPARDAGHAQLPIRDQRLRARGQSVQIAPRAVH